LGPKCHAKWKFDDGRSAAMSEVIIHRTDGAGLPTRARRGTAEAADVRLTRLIAIALPADAAPVSELGFTTQLAAIAAASKAALAACGGDLQGLRCGAALVRV